MSCDYRFKFRGRIASGKETTHIVESYTFPRTEVEEYVAKFKAKTDKHPGEEALLKLLQLALEKKSLRKITIKVER